MQLVPHKFKIIDTNLLAYVFVQHGIIKKKVSDNLKEAAGRIIKQQLKPLKDVTAIEYQDMELSKECEYLIKNFLYFKNKYRSTITSEVITTYISYIMITDKSLNCYKFFDDCIYVKEKQDVIDELYLNICTFAGATVSEVLKDYGEYLTDPLFYKEYNCSYREKEINETISTLCRMNKCNAILVGNSGVGKTTIVKGICNIIQSPSCPDDLRGYSVFSLNVNKIMSGTTYRGDLEKRLDMIVDELRKQQNTILFIDELHTLFSRDGELSPIQNVLKPYLAETSKVIGCTTNSEYKIIESDKAFERRFSIVRVEEMSIEQTIQTLKDQRKRYEDFHKIKISDSIISYIVNKCSVYIKNRYFPDKAFDILDRSCVRSKLQKCTGLKEEDVDETIYNFCNISPNSLSFERIKSIENDICSSIIGQNHAVKSVCDCLTRYCIGVNNKKKPIGSLLFVGPTGTGKTELCKQISEKVFSEECFIRFDMSEFMESHSVSKLIGSPPGYIGFNKGGTLTELVKHNPFSVILFDEVEKAHKDVVNIMLQIMDDGRLTDSFGTVVDFCNCLIVMTSNLGCKEYMNKNAMGFTDISEKDQGIIKHEIENYFTPEFLNRLTDIIYFNTLTKEAFDTIYENEIKSFINLYEENGINISIDPAANDYIKDHCFDDKNGVRFIKNNIARLMENEIFNNIDKNLKQFNFYVENNILKCERKDNK